jgi:hypothetical protein
VTNKNPEITAAVQDQPLSFTVHGMPVPDASAPAGPNTRAGRWKMFVVLLVCVAPILASYFTYYVIRPEGRRNFGDLIDPQRPLPAISGRTLDGQVVQLPSLKGQWLLTTVSGGACDASCEKNLYFQRQMREALGKEMGRVDRLWLITDDAPVAPGLLPALKGATVLRVSPAALAQWLQPDKGKDLQNHLYVVDPIGNWMMRFPPDMDAASAAKAKRDLDRLLRAAGGWDTEGRDAK